MFDKFFIPVIKAPLECLAKPLIKRGIHANQVTLVGFAIGLCGALLIATDWYLLGLFAIALNRLCDGLDGSIARTTQSSSDAGGYLDIVLDFIFYSAVVVGFAAAAPEQNALAAAFLIWSFMGTGSSFLAFAIMAAKRNIEQLDYGKKSLYFLGGITEGTETIACFVLMCLFPGQFVLLAMLFGGLCWVTTVTRIYAAYKMLSAG
ncbi:Inner membrane protein YnjF [Marinomonas aquimarina]|uniref:Inner membrane protein YnjF n=1 Tax=Marinomonas aquimarina TaxID=295068 RepID=A0A1A8T341_9GAMM|nr:CDP-alcohol phosphatidyltransferase family protein [Marinomonas aquimarina]SBS26536.1 Inner membrane protein YnjF [Marinomonas aquimarina]